MNSMGAFMNALFFERQKMLPMPYRALVALLGVVLLILSYLCYNGTIVQEGKTFDIYAFIVTSAISVSIILLALFLTLTVTVTETEITIRTLGTKRIQKSDIDRVVLIDQVHAVRDYGGWGIRYWFKGKGYTIPGNKGAVEIHIKGAKFGTLITSMRPEELCDSLRSN